MSKAKPEPRCWDCGAPNDPGARECWLCHRQDWLSGAIASPAGGGSPRGASRRSTWDQFSKGEIASLLGWFAIAIMPALVIISAVIGLFRICSGMNR